MDSMVAFAMGEASRGKELMVFDWAKAARLIKESGCNYAEAGLEDDWEYTGGSIWKDGKIVAEDDTYVYLASTCATPMLRFGAKEVPCYVMQSKRPKWGADTYWPKEARNIIKSRRSVR